MNERHQLVEGGGIAFRRRVANPTVASLSALFAILIGAQSCVFLVLGTERGRGLSATSMVLVNVVALLCSFVAFRRARGVAALYWFLFSATLVALLVPTVVFAYETIFHQSTLSDSTWRLLYCLYGAPVMMMLFLPDTHQREQLKWEIGLDLFQVAVVVTLIYSTFFFLPVQSMEAGDALIRNLIVSNLHTFFLLVATIVRLLFARVRSSRGLLSRLALFLLSCTLATFIGDWIDQHHYTVASAWFDLGWEVPCVVASMIAITWRPMPEPTSTPEHAPFWNFLTSNLVLVAMLSGIHLLMDRWKAAHGSAITSMAVVASLVAFTLRLALTQYHQQQEISRRKAAQGQLTLANNKINVLLDDSRRQTQEITQVSELASLLQASASRAEVFRILPERLRSLFKGASGSVSMISASKNRVESVAEWGPNPPTDQIFAPEECWALRRGCTHAHGGGVSALRCAHLAAAGASVCIPLIANGDMIGTLAIQDNSDLSNSNDADTIANDSAWRRQLAAAIAEHIAVAVANLSLREALRLQAVRDPLTGLYNRRYMEEFLDRELHRALRKRRPVAVMMLDLDHFKRYNDTFGHAAGDRALAAVGETLLRSMRAEDVACRYGGEEFAIILSECSLQQATQRANEIRQHIKNYRFQNDEHARGPISVSVGVAAFDETTDRVDLLLKFADEALYQAKRAGRDCVVAAEPATTARPEPAEPGMTPAIAST